ncbi:hypothetical protein JRQ81_005862 [Phrynocephalus forsythii]|uniref:Centrosomal protein of 68 kDa n=1 Tax=Phrynocephalus forsythii TaxID=171643 RepID=A0A9Q0Y5U9_9SAUR|nr:hypothetical protein JRQ81_005862 [Phrynocephalus forsythii]
MALEVEKSPSDASLNVRAKCCDRWNYMDLEMEYPELVITRVGPPLDVKEGWQWLRGAEDDEEPAAVEGAGHAALGIPERHQNPSALPSGPSSSFSKIKATAKYVESQPLICRSSRSGDVPFHLSRGGLHPEQQQKWFAQKDPAERSAFAGAFGSLLDLPRVPPARGVDSTFSSRTTRPLRHLDIECTGQMLLPPHSSTPKHVPSKRNTHLGPTMPVSPGTSLSLQCLEDSDLKQQEIGSSKSFSAAAAAARSQSETSAPWNLPSRFDLQGRGLVGPAKQRPLDSCSLMGRIRNMSSFQADYWACAIPDCLPPSPDRQSPHWDPDKEYEDLLDYTYPLRPKHKLDKNDSTVHDSGVDLDSLSISPESSLKILAVQDQEQEMTGIQNGQGSPVPSLTRVEHPAPVSHYRLSPVGKVSFPEGDPSAGEMDRFRMTAHGLSPWGLSPGASGMMSLEEKDRKSRGHDCLRERDAAAGGTFLRSTQVLPLPVASSGDEEYLSLPPRLKELKTLAQQLTDMSLAMMPSEPHPAEDDLPSFSVKREHLPKDDGSEKTQWEPYSDSCHTSSFHKRAEECILNKKSGKDHERMLRENAGQDHLAVRCLDFPERGIHPISNLKDCYRDSLTERIKIFCGQLEELIHWLHKIADVTDNWIPPRPDIESIKTSLQNYLEFKKDLAGHHALIQDVLQDGERLLKYMASDSPVLQNTLRLITQQSNELENHAEHLYESIVAAMDALGAGLMKDCDAQQIAASAESSKSLITQARWILLLLKNVEPETHAVRQITTSRSSSAHCPHLYQKQLDALTLVMPVIDIQFCSSP